MERKARQGEARQGKTRQGKARQGKARQGKARQGKARQGKARQGKARQGKARQRMTYFFHDTEELFLTEMHEHISRIVIILPFIVKHSPSSVIERLWKIILFDNDSYT
jgi:hypothetical protein